MRYSVIPLLLFLTSCGQQLAPPAPLVHGSTDQPPDCETLLSDEHSFPQITVELATMHSPDELISLFSEFQLCEAGKDQLYDCYLNVLKPETDRRFPDAVEARRHVESVFVSIHEMQLFSSGVGNHEGARIPGHVEHVLYQCFQHDVAFATDENGSLNDIEELALKIEKEMNSNDVDFERQHAEFSRARETFFTSLNAVVAIFDEQGRKYLFQQIASDLRRWLRLNAELR